jgi:hypothetical protein
MQHHTIHSDFLEAIRQAGGTGKYQEFADNALRGFGVKVTPNGGISHVFPCTASAGIDGRTSHPQYGRPLSRGARICEEIGVTLERSSDDDITIIEKRAARKPPVTCDEFASFVHKLRKRPAEFAARQ